MNKIISTDLDMTDNCMAVMEDEKPIATANAEGVRTTLSVVVPIKTGERLIGELARRQAITSADKIIPSIRRHMGTDYRVDINGKRHTPQEISAMVPQKLKADVESYLGETVTKMVITVPTYLNDTQRQATKDVGKTTGLDVKRIINEPTAATPAYGPGNGKEQKIMVYGLSGGTFDVSTIEVSDGIIEALSTNGDTRLGGDDFDNAIINWTISEFKKAEGMDLSNDKMTLQRLKEAAEKAKKGLSTVTTTNINLPSITAMAEGSKHLDTNLTRAEFDEPTHGLVERTAIPIQNALEDTGIIASELSKMSLIGSSTYMIAAREKVKQLTGRGPSKSLSLGEYIAIGVAIQGGKLAGDTDAGDILPLGVTPLSLSIETMDGVATKLIEGNTTIPTKKSQIFSTTADNQTAVDIHAVQGERQSAGDNKTSGQFRLDKTSPARRGTSQIEVIFNIDASGIVNVPAKDLGIDKEQYITITSGSNMSSDNIDKTMKGIAKYETQGKKREEAIDARNDADSVVFQIGKAPKEVGDKIAPGDKAEVETDLSSSKETINQASAEEMTDAQVKDIKTGREKLMSSTQKLFAKVYEQAQASGVAGQAGPDMGGTGNATGGDDTVDADFKEV